MLADLARSRRADAHCPRAGRRQLHRIQLVAHLGAIQFRSIREFSQSAILLPKDRLTHKGKPKTGEGSGKVGVFGMLDRETRQVRAQIIPNVKREVLLNAIIENIEKGSTIYSDGLKTYKSLEALEFVHDSVNHFTEYVRGEVHTNGIENFWSLLKRGLRGTYVAVEPFHLSRYIDEQVFRFNNRATKDNPLNDADRFMLAASQISGKRLTYAELTGNAGETKVN
ncbi:MAG TPA: IS1595 family transposase [Terracidiphilus sp.]